VHNIIPTSNHKVPAVTNSAALVNYFAAQSERIQLMLATSAN
jgi:hypothetical protein